jgi:hypothetical protein
MEDSVLGSDVVEGQILVVLENAFRKVSNGLVQLLVAEHDVLESFFADNVKRNLRFALASNFHIIFK